MKYQYVFEWLDRLVAGAGNPESETYSGLTQETIPAYLKRVSSECESIRATLIKELFCLKNERALELRVEQYQATLVRLLDAVDQQSKKGPVLFDELYRNLKAALEALLRFMEQHFQRFFNQEQPVPRAYWQISRKSLLQQSRRLATVPLQGTADLQARAIVLRLLQPLLNSREAPTYRQKNYLETLLTALAAAEGSAATEPWLSPFQEQLLYLNFNHAEIISLLVREMEQKIPAGADPEVKRAAFLQALQTIQQLPLKPGFAFFPDLPAVTHFLIQWLQFELDYLPSPLQQSTMHMPLPPEEQESKIQLSVSVAMLGLFLRLLTEEGIITNKNQSGLVRFFAQHCTTTRQTAISSDSLYGSYFKPQPGTVRMMKECLLRLQGLLHKKF